MPSRSNSLRKDDNPGDFQDLSLEISAPTSLRDGLYSALGAPNIEHLPLAVSIQEGRHTPPYRLDDVYLKGLTADVRHDAGVKLMVLDGTSSGGTSIWGDTRPQLEGRHELVGGYYVEKVPDLFSQVYKDTPSRFDFPVGELKHPDYHSMRHTTELIDKYGEQDSHPWAKLIRGLENYGLQEPELMYNSPYCTANRIQITNNPEDCRQKFVVPIGPGEDLPAGFTKGMYNGFFGMGIGSFQERRLERQAKNYFKSLSPAEVFGKMFDLEVVRFGVPVLAALTETSKMLYPDFEARFQHAPKLRTGGVSFSGLILLPENQGVLLFALGDCVAGAARDGKHVYASQQYHPLMQHSFSSIGARAAGDSGQSRAIVPQKLVVKHFDAAIAKKMLFYFCSDGCTSEGRGGEGLQNFMNSTERSLTSASEFVATAKNYTEQAAIRNQRKWLENLPVQHNRKVNLDFPRDDETIVAIEGALLFT